MVGWIAFETGQVTIMGDPVTYESSEHGRRMFCGTCGSGLFYTNAEMLPGITDIQSCTLDDPQMVEPMAQIQIAERLGWMTTAQDLPVYDRFPDIGSIVAIVSLRCRTDYIEAV